MEILGIDIGGSGIKGAPVNIETGKLTAERHRILTPQPTTPEAVGDVIAEIVQHFNRQGIIGCAFPAVIKNGVAYTAANVEQTWIGTNIEQLVKEKTGCAAFVLNDADAAGFAEMELGAGKDNKGVVIMHTLGTGIGSVIFVNGQIVPNTEFGRLEIRCKEAEQRASARSRTEEDLKWKTWAIRVNEFLARMETLFWPDLIIIGGGVSRKHKKFLPFLQTRAALVPAQMLNQAGIIGAAIAANKHFENI